MSVPSFSDTDSMSTAILNDRNKNKINRKIHFSPKNHNNNAGNIGNKK